MAGELSEKTITEVLKCQGRIYQRHDSVPLSHSSLQPSGIKPNVTPRPQSPPFGVLSTTGRGSFPEGLGDNEVTVIAGEEEGRSKEGRKLV